MADMDLGSQDFDLSGMSEEELQQLISLGVIDENMAENARQMTVQEQLRYGAAPEGRSAGRVYVAASPLEHIAKGMERYNAAKRMKELEAQRGVMQKDQTAGRGTYWDLLRGKRKVGLGSLQGQSIEFPELNPEDYAAPRF